MSYMGSHEAWAGGRRVRIARAAYGDLVQSGVARPSSAADTRLVSLEAYQPSRRPVHAVDITYDRSTQAQQPDVGCIIEVDDPTFTPAQCLGQVVDA